MSGGDGLFLFAAGVVAGIIGTAGGVTSLAAYPALLAVGLAPFTANVTNSVALLGSGIGSAARAGPDLVGHAATLRRWMPGTVVMSALGAVLLLVTPSGVFDRVVPYLVATGATILLAQPALARLQRGRDLPRGVVGTAAAGAAAYNGYFGAGSGILMITLLMLTTESQLHRANSLKNVILVAADVLPAVLFVSAGTVVWGAVWTLGAGALVGGLIGPSVARRVPAAVLRVLIALCGYVLAVGLWRG